MTSSPTSSTAGARPCLSSRFLDAASGIGDIGSNGQAAFPGKVHGVVVQAKMEASSSVSLNLT